MKFSILVEITHTVKVLQVFCETRFDQPKPGTSSHNAATNVPYYQHWNEISALTVCCKYIAIFSCLCVSERICFPLKYNLGDRNFCTCFIAVTEIICF